MMIYRGERPVVVASDPELISQAPIFDFETAAECESLARAYIPKRYKALKIAVTLALYNEAIEQRQSEAGGESRTWRRLGHLLAQEAEASRRENPLATVGFEVESPRRVPIYFEQTYGRFFDQIGMPRNRVNNKQAYHVKNLFDSWEFSPPPSYSARVQARILSELIKGGFIPSLSSPYEPEKVKAILDNKMVSLHINLGIPKWVKQEIKVNEKGLDDLNLLVLLFALGYTSPLRLESRHSSQFIYDKEADRTNKSGARARRLEFKPLEVSNARSFRLIREMQLVGTAYFASLVKSRSPAKKSFADIWHKTGLGIAEVLSSYGIDGRRLNYKQEFALMISKVHREISGEMRNISAGATRQVRNLLTESDSVDKGNLGL